MNIQLGGFRKSSIVVVASLVIHLGLSTAVLAQAIDREDKSALQSVVQETTTSRSEATFGQTAPVAQAQTVGGCDDSPENPTLVLAILAGAVFWVVSYRRNKKIVEG
jgi:XrtJ-associated TM-motif-TM protein